MSHLFMDLSEYELAPMAEAYFNGIRSSISEKVIFASADPFVEQSEAINIYKKMDLSDGTRMSANL